MKKPSSGEKCVYTHSRNRKVFYVGMGSVRRAYETGRRPAGWYEECPDLQFKVKICADNLTAHQAKKLEEKLYQKHCKHLTNKPILEPGVNALEHFNWEPSVLCSKISGRSIDVPWMMLDSYNLPKDPFRMQITISGKTKRFFAPNISKLFGDFCRFALSQVMAPEMFDAKRKADISGFIACYEFWIKHGSKRFMQLYANKTRYRETLDFYVQANIRLGVSRLDSQRKYHADCLKDRVAMRNHKNNIADLKTRFSKAFDG